MENTNGLTNPRSSLGYDNNGKNVPLAPFPFLLSSTSNPNSSTDESEGTMKFPEGVNQHQRCSSESFLEEQPSWLEDLLNDSESTLFHRGGHRRSASDSYAYYGEAAETFTIQEEPKFVNAYLGMPIVETKTNSFSKKIHQETEGVSSLGVGQSREESSSQNLGDGGSQVKPSGTKSDTKRAKQHNAHRSRVRKLQYIAHLERTVQILKAEGSEVSAELEFVEQQNMILNMENRTLRQRLETISQEQIIKHWEQGMLEREIGRLQTLYHQQIQQQMQLHQQQTHNQHPKQRRNRSRDFDHQVNNSSFKNKDASSSKGSL